MKTASYWIEHLDLLPHPEGGFYKETYRSLSLFSERSETRFPAGRAYSTAIYYLLNPGEFSAFHRIKSDEIWHFYEGGPLEVLYFKEGLQRFVLGRDVGKGELLQAVVPAGAWFASRPLVENYTLVGCTVAPGFDFRDFELARAKDLMEEFPGNAEIIRELSP